MFYVIASSPKVLNAVAACKGAGLDDKELQKIDEVRLDLDDQWRLICEEFGKLSETTYLLNHDDVGRKFRQVWKVKPGCEWALCASQARREL